MTITAFSLLIKAVMEKVHSNHAGGQSSKERIMAQDALTQLFKAWVGAIYSDAYQFELMIFILYNSIHDYYKSIVLSNNLSGDTTNSQSRQHRAIHNYLQLPSPTKLYGRGKYFYNSILYRYIVISHLMMDVLQLLLRSKI